LTKGERDFRFARQLALSRGHPPEASVTGCHSGFGISCRPNSQLNGDRRATCRSYVFSRSADDAVADDERWRLGIGGEEELDESRVIAEIGQEPETFAACRVAGEIIGFGYYQLAFPRARRDELISRKGQSASSMLLGKALTGSHGSGVSRSRLAAFGGQSNPSCFVRMRVAAERAIIGASADAPEFGRGAATAAAAKRVEDGVMGCRGLETQSIERQANCKRHLTIIVANSCHCQPVQTRKLTFLEA